MRSLIASFRLIAFVAIVLFLVPERGLCQVSGGGGTQYYPPIYVDIDATHSGAGDGQSWSTAFKSLDSALAVVQPEEEIWIAESAAHHYVPSNLSTGFQISRAIRIYGGFRSGDASVAQRTGSGLNTVMEGNTVAYHIISIAEISQSEVLIDSVTIQNSYALSPNNNGSPNGGGILAPCADLFLANIRFYHNIALNGGGLYFGGGCTIPETDPEQSPIPAESIPHQLRIKNSLFLSDGADDSGGGIYGTALFGEVVNTAFLDCHCAGNTLGTGGGGGVHLRRMGDGNALSLTDCAFDKCFMTSPTNGGGLSLQEEFGGGARAHLMNCTFAGNNCTSLDGGAIYISPLSACSVDNAIFFHNYFQNVGIGVAGSTALNDCSIDFIWTQPWNHTLFNNDPHFVNFIYTQVAVNDDLRLSSNSLCIDAGNYDVLPHDNLDVDGDYIFSEWLPRDLVLQGRAYNDGQGGGHGGHGARNYLDMGACEYHP